LIFKTDGKGTDLNGFLDRGSHLEGELSFETTFRIDGRFTGRVKSSGDLIVGEAGELEGEIEVGQIFISGTVRGSIRATKKVEITPTGKAFADLSTPTLVVGNGALFEGNCIMTRAEETKGAASRAASSAPAEPDAGTRPAVKEAPRNRKGDGAIAS
jgi:cytoskeletal protein CcmA (bactofilin family)